VVLLLIKFLVLSSRTHYTLHSVTFEAKLNKSLDFCAFCNRCRLKYCESEGFLQR